MRASSRGVKIPEVFLTSRNVNNSPSTVHINFQTTGRKEWAEERQVGEGGQEWLVYDGVRGRAALFLTNESIVVHRRCEHAIPTRILETGVPVIIFVGFFWRKNLCIYNSITPQRLRLLSGLMTNADCMEVVRKWGFCNFYCITFASVTSSTFDSPDSTKYCSSVAGAQLCYKVTFSTARIRQYLFAFAVFSHWYWLSLKAWDVINTLTTWSTAEYLQCEHSRMCRRGCG